MTGGGVRVRDARPDERAAVRALTLAAYAELAGVMEPEAWAGLDEAVRTALDSEGPAERIVAEEDGALLGSVMLYPPAVSAYGEVAGVVSWPELRLLAVAPAARGRGVGRLLVEECVRRARTSGARELGLHTSESMRVAVEMYRRMGFVRDPEHDFQPRGAELVEAYRLPLEMRDPRAAGAGPSRSSGGMISEAERYRGCLLGLACGDALGATAEFQPRGSFPPIADLVGGGPFGLPPGAWTDDTSMALCLAHSLLYRRGFDPADQMNRYCNWEEHGYLSSTGPCFDIGATVAAALRRYRVTGDPFSGSTDPRSAGNGCIMRLAPVSMFYAADLGRTVHYSGESARTTHGAAEAVECTKLFGAQLRAALLGRPKDEVLLGSGYQPTLESVAALASGAYLEKTVDEIAGSGYVVKSLEAALWCFRRTPSYAEAVLTAANLGDDADTTAAVCGQLAGAHYGAGAIPPHWLERLVMRAEIEELADRLLAERVQA